MEVHTVYAIHLPNYLCIWSMNKYLHISDFPSHFYPRKNVCNGQDVIWDIVSKQRRYLVSPNWLKSEAHTIGGAAATATHRQRLVRATSWRYAVYAIHLPNYRRIWSMNKCLHIPDFPSHFVSSTSQLFCRSAVKSTHAMEKKSAVSSPTLFSLHFYF